MISLFTMREKSEEMLWKQCVKEPSCSLFPIEKTVLLLYAYIKEIEKEIIELSLKQMLKNLRDSYVRKQAQTAVLPAFSSEKICRYRAVFSGRVQNVGFRLETYELAKRLGLTGFCQNLDNGDVLAELQGPEDKIRFLISFMDSLMRIKIKNKEITALELNHSESAFLQL